MAALLYLCDIDRLPVGIDDVSRQLEDEGVEKFDKPFDELTEALAQRSPRHLTEQS